MPRIAAATASALVANRKCFRTADLLAVVEVGQMLVEQLHSRVPVGNRLRESVDASLANQLADHRCGPHDLHDGQASTLESFGESLADDGLQARFELQEQQIAFGRWEHGNQSLNGQGRIRRVHRAEYQVTCIGGLQCRTHRFLIAQLSDQNKIRILTQRPFQRFREPRCVCPEFPLGDQALVRNVNETQSDPQWSRFAVSWCGSSDR